MLLFTFLSICLIGLMWSIVLAFKAHWVWGVTVSFLPIAHIAFFLSHINLKTFAAFSITWVGLVSAIYFG